MIQRLTSFFRDSKESSGNQQTSGVVGTGQSSSLQPPLPSSHGAVPVRRSKPWIERQTMARVMREQEERRKSMERQLEMGVGEERQSVWKRPFRTTKTQQTSRRERFQNERTATFGPQVEVLRGQVAPEFYLKFVIVGAPSVGKTTLLQRYIASNRSGSGSGSRRSNSYTTSGNYMALPRVTPSIGIDMHTCRLRRSRNILRKLPTPVRIKLLDVPHAELAGHHLSSIFEGAHGAIIVFDVTDMRSIKAVDQWRAVIPESISDNVLLCAHKCDRRLARHIITPTGLDMYVRAGGYIGWQMTTAKSESSARIAIDYLVDHVLQKILLQRKPLVSTSDMVKPASSSTDAGRLQMVRSVPNMESSRFHAFHRRHYSTQPQNYFDNRSRPDTNRMADNAVAGSFLSPLHYMSSEAAAATTAAVAGKGLAPWITLDDGYHDHEQQDSSYLSSFTPSQSSDYTDVTMDSTMQILADMDDDMLFHPLHQHYAHHLQTVVEEMESDPFTSVNNSVVDGKQWAAPDSSDTTSMSSASSNAATNFGERTNVAANLNTDIHQLVRSTSMATMSADGSISNADEPISIEKKRSVVELFADEVRVFYMHVKARFTEYLEFVKNSSINSRNDGSDNQMTEHDIGIRRELVHLIIMQSVREERSLLQKLAVVLAAYGGIEGDSVAELTNSEDMRMRCMFIEQKRAFYTGVMKKWTTLWQSLKMEMTLHELAGCRLLPSETCSRLLEQFRHSAKIASRGDKSRKADESDGSNGDWMIFNGYSDIKLPKAKHEDYFRFRFSGLGDFFEIDNDSRTALCKLKLTTATKGDDDNDGSESP